MSHSKRPFEKYKPGGLFSEFYGGCVIHWIALSSFWTTGARTLWMSAFSLHGSLPPILPKFVVFNLSWGYLTKFETGRLRPVVHPLTLYNYTILGSKGTPFRIPYINKWYPFSIPNLQLCISLNCSKCTLFKIWIKPKPERFVDFFTAIKSSC